MFGFPNYGTPPWYQSQQPQPTAAVAPATDPSLATPTEMPAAPALPPRPQFNPGGFEGDFQHGSFNLPGFTTTGSVPGTAWTFGDMSGNMPGRGGGGNITWGGGPQPAPLPASGSTPGVPTAPGAPNTTGTPAGGPPRWGGMMGRMFSPPTGGAADGGFGASFPRLGQLFPGAGQQGQHRGLLGGLLGGLFHRGGMPGGQPGGITGGPGQGQGAGMQGGGGRFHMPLQGASFWNPSAARQGPARKAAPGTPAAAATEPAKSIAAGEPNPSTPEPDADEKGGPSDGDADDKDKDEQEI